MEKQINPRKAAVLSVRLQLSHSCQSRLFSEMVLLDANFDKADGEAKDISHGIPVPDT